MANLIKDVLLHESRDEDDDDDGNIENVTLPFTLNDADDVSCSTAHGADVITVCVMNLRGLCFVVPY